jgi:hypothetical protein
MRYSRLGGLVIAVIDSPNLTSSRRASWNWNIIRTVSIWDRIDDALNIEYGDNLKKLLLGHMD